jgi:hypothetical protein
MTSSYSTDLKLELMVTGENAGTWGDKTNTNLNLLQQAIAGYQAVSIAGGAQTTALVMSNATISNARNAVVKLTGTITGNQIVTIPDGIEKTYIVENGTSGAFTVEFKTVSGTGPTFSTTDKGIKIVYSDGTNVVDVNANLSGPTLASDLDVNGKSIISTSNGNITLAPNGTGDVYLDADTVRIGDSNSNATLTTNGTGDLILNTNSGTNSGSITIADGTNGNISITPNGTGSIVLDGLNWPQADGSASQVLQTNGSGQLSFGTISSSPTQLVQSRTLATGASYTAGQLASIGVSGEVVALPTLNTFGTTRTNSSTTGYSAISMDGSRVLKAATTGSGTSFTVTYSGIAISNSANPTNGTVSVSENISGFPGAPNVQILAADNNKFQVLQIAWARIFDPCGGAYYQVYRGRIFTVVVDASGNCTKGNVLSYDGSNGYDGTLLSYFLRKLTDTIFAFDFTATSAIGGFSADFKRIITLSSTSTTTQTTDTDAQYWMSANGSNSFLTTNNILGIAFDNTWRTATYTASPPAIGTYTDTTIVGDYLSGGSWTRMAAPGDFAGEYLLGTYTDTNGVSKYVTFSVNQTTGALTQVSTGLASVISNNAGGSMVYKDKNNFIGSNGSFSFTNGVPNSPAFNTPYTFGTMRYNSGDLFYSFSTDLSGFPTNTGYTVVSYATNSFNYLGVVKTTDSTSPIDIVTDGVATGFTSLTPGTVYYATAPANGTVTTSGTILIGKAISATEILLQRSLTQ